MLQKCKRRLPLKKDDEFFRMKNRMVLQKIVKLILELCFLVDKTSRYNLLVPHKSLEATGRDSFEILTSVHVKFLFLEI